MEISSEWSTKFIQLEDERGMLMMNRLTSMEMEHVLLGISNNVLFEEDIFRKCFTRKLLLDR